MVAAIDKHRTWLVDRGELARHREARAAAEMEAIALGALRDRLGSLRNATALPKLASRVAARELDAYIAADELLRGLSS